MPGAIEQGRRRRVTGVPLNVLEDSSNASRRWCALSVGGSRDTMRQYRLRGTTWTAPAAE